MAYVPTAVGTVADPLYFTLLTVPPTEPLTVAACGEPLAVTGEFPTDNVGVAMFTVSVPGL